MSAKACAQSKKATSNSSRRHGSHTTTWLTTPHSLNCEQSSAHPHSGMVALLSEHREHDTAKRGDFQEPPCYIGFHHRVAGLRMAQAKRQSDTRMSGQAIKRLRNGWSKRQLLRVIRAVSAWLEM